MNVFSEAAEDVLYVGFHKLDSKAHKTYQILVRPDVSEDSLLTLAQQILITYSGAVSKHLPSSIDESVVVKAQDRSTPSPTNAVGSKQQDTTQAKDSAGKSGIDKPTVAAAGANITSTASTVTAINSNIGTSNLGMFGGIAPNSFSNQGNSNTQTNNVHSTAAPSAAVHVTPARKAYLEFCETLALELNTAMREESLTIDYMSSVPASLTGPMQGFSHMGGDHSGGVGGRRALDSLIDLNFIRDLHCATAQLMTLRLLEQAERLDSRVKIIEQKCARLMTLLKPSYVRAKLDLPTPPAYKSILTYDLVLDRAPIGDSINMELWKLVLLRARRKCREILNTKSHKMLHSTHNSHHHSSGSGAVDSAEHYKNYDNAGMKTEAQIVLQCITEQFVDWAQEEYKQRLFRKIHCVKDRLETIHRFRVQLILALHERFVVNGLANGNSAVTTSSWLFNSNPDLTYQKAVREKFPFLDLNEPVIFDTNAILLNGKHGLFDAAAAALNGKTGTLYLTLGYAMFYSGGGFLSAPPEIVVVALRSVICLEVVAEDGTVISCMYNDASERVSIQHGESLLDVDTTTLTGASSVRQRAITPSAKLPYTIRLVDSAGTIDITLEVKGLTEDYTRRVADLLDLIIKDKMYVLRHSASPQAAPRNALANADHTSQVPHGSTALYQRISDIDDIMDLLALPATAAVTGSGADIKGEDSTGRNSESSVGSSGSNNSVIDVEATIAQQTRLQQQAEQHTAAVSAPSMPAHRPLEPMYRDLIDLTVPIVPTTVAVAPSQPASLSSALYTTLSSGPPPPPVKQSDSSHLLELESFFDELSYGISNISTVEGVSGNCGHNSPGMVGAGLSLSKPTSTVSLSAAQQSNAGAGISNSNSQAELDLFDDMLLSTVTTEPSTAAMVSPQSSTAAPVLSHATLPLPAVPVLTSSASEPVPVVAAVPVPKEVVVPAPDSDAGQQAAEPTSEESPVVAAAPAKKSLTGNIQKFLAQQQAAKAKAAADARK